jgi:hypothetical protein
MFTGFASENTPAIQVWDFFQSFASSSAIRSVSLPDDCAPIQVFRTGSTGAAAIRVYLPTAPIEGKQITIVNQQYGLNVQYVTVFSSDTSSNGTGSVLSFLGAGDSLVLVYSKQNITFGTVSGATQTGWFLLNKSSTTAANAFSAIAGGNSNSAAAQYTFIGGGLNNTTNNTYATVVGGSSNAASGTSSAVVGGSSNTASGQNSAVIAGANNTAENTNAVVVGGATNIANSQRSAVVGGSINVTTGGSAAVVGGNNSLASGQDSAVIAGNYGTTRVIVGNLVFPASAQPIASLVGATQSGLLLLGRQTTDATSTRLTSNPSAATTNNQVILPNNSAYTFQGTCIANVTAGGTTSGWKFEGVIKRGANAASTTLVAAVTPTVIAQDAGAAAWVLAITADTTNGGIAVTVTGAAATTIRWVCKIETTEVTF